MSCKKLVKVSAHLDAVLHAFRFFDISFLLAKSLLEEMRIASKTKKAEPILTTEEKASKVNKAEIKGTGFQMKMVSSLKGAEMIEAQRDSRRQRHIACLKECEKFVEQFYDNFSEKKNEITFRRSLRSLTFKGLGRLIPIL